MINNFISNFKKFIKIKVIKYVHFKTKYLKNQKKVPWLVVINMNKTGPLSFLKSNKGSIPIYWHSSLFWFCDGSGGAHLILIPFKLYSVYLSNIFWQMQST